MGKYQNRRARIKATGENGTTVRSTWWKEIGIGATLGGVDSMDLFTFLIDDLEDELARAGIRGVQFYLNGDSIKH